MRPCPRCGRAFPQPAVDARGVARCPGCGEPVAAPPASLPSGGPHSLRPTSAPLLTLRASASGDLPAGMATPAGSFAAPTAPGVPRQIGRYAVRGEIGRGGMGVVYRAHDAALDRDVAIKMIHGSGPTMEPDERERFIREARVCARLRHPNIVGVHEAGSHGGQLYIVMDLVEGESLEERLARELPPPERAAEMARDLARALDHAHDHGVIHRDVKPQNVIIDAKDGRTLLTDFGLAGDTRTTLHLTVTGVVVGTPSYMAPEQASGLDPTPRPAVDIWAVGALLYRATVGHPPFQGEHAIEVLQKVISDPPIRPRAVVDAIPADLETITLRCLEKDPDDRYPSAAAVAEELGRFLAGRSIRARPVGRAARVLRWSRRNRARAVALLATVVLAGLGLGMAIALAARAVDDARASAAALRTRLAAAEELARAERARADRLAAEAGAGSEAEPDRERGGDAASGPASSDAERVAMLVERAAGLLARNHHQEAWATAAGALAITDDVRARIIIARARARTAWLRFTTSVRHGGERVDVAWSPDGATLATADTAGVRLWDGESRRARALILPEDGPATAVAWSDDGRRLLSASGPDGTVRAWDPADGAPVARLGAHGVGVVALAAVGDHVTAVGADLSTRRWPADAIDGEPAASRPGLARDAGWVGCGHGRLVAVVDGDVLHGALDDDAPLQRVELAGVGTVRAAAPLPDGRLLVGTHRGQIHLVRPGEEVRRVDLGRATLSAPIIAIAASDDGRRAIAISGAGVRIHLALDPPAVRNMVRFVGHQATWRAAFRAGGRQVAVIDDAGFVHIDDPDGAGELAGLYGASGPVLSIAGGPSIASTYADRFIRFHDGQTGEIARALGPTAGEIVAVRWLGDGGLVEIDDHGGIAILRGDARDQTLAPVAGRIDAAALAPDGAMAAIAGSDTLRIVRTRDGAVLARHDHVGEAAAVGVGGGKVAIALTDQSRVGLVEGNRVTAMLQASAPVTRIAISADGRLVALAAEDYSLHLHDLAQEQTGPGLPNDAAHDARITALAFPPTAVPTLLSGDAHGKVRIWNVARRVQIGTFVGGAGAIEALGYAPDHEILTGTTDGAIRSWEVARVSWEISPQTFESGATAIAWRDPDFLFAVTAGGEIGLFDFAVRGWEVMRAGYPLASVAASDGERLAVGGDGGRITVHLGEDDARDLTLPGGDGIDASETVVHGLAFTDDGDLLAVQGISAGPDGWKVVRRIELPELTVDPTPVVELGAGGVVGVGRDGRRLAWFDGASERTFLGRTSGGAPTELGARTGRLHAHALDLDRAVRTVVVGGHEHGRRGRQPVLLRVLGVDGQDRLRLGPEGDEIKHLSVRPGGDIAASAGTEPDVTLWEIPSGRVLQRWRVPSTASGLRWSPDGRRLASVEESGRLALWSFEVLDESRDALIDQARRRTGLVAGPEGDLVSVPTGRLGRRPR